MKNGLLFNHDSKVNNVGDYTLDIDKNPLESIAYTLGVIAAILDDFRDDYQEHDDTFRIHMNEINETLEKVASSVENMEPEDV